MTARSVLPGDVTYYYRSDGLETNDGLSDTPGGAFRTAQRAVNEAAKWDFFGRAITVKHAAEPSPVFFADPIVIPHLTGGGALNLIGDARPGYTIRSSTGADTVTLSGTGGTGILIDNMTIAGGELGSVKVNQSSLLNLGGGLVWGDATHAHIYVHDKQGLVYILGANYKIRGGGAFHVRVNAGMVFWEKCHAALENNPLFSQFVNVANAGVLQAINLKFTGTARGERYIAAAGGVINVFGQGKNLFPGNADGREETGGVYAP